MTWRAIGLGLLSAALGGCGLLLDLDEPDPQSVDGGANVARCTTAGDCAIDLCTGQPECRSNTCVYPARPRCDDGIDCTDDRCDPAQGCVHEPRNARCDDGVSCSGDTCVPGVGCTHQLDDGACADAHRCTTDRCTRTGCVHVPVDALCGRAACDPSEGCVGEQCTEDADCAAGPCDAEVSCEDGRCVSGGTLPDGESCDDGDPCTLASACANGACVGTIFVDNCGPCASCDRESGGGCDDPRPARDGDACDDENACTGPGVCAGGVCTPGANQECPPRQCQMAVGCDATSGCMYAPVAADQRCDPHMACMTGLCVAGTCVPQPIDCGPGGVCDPTNNQCVCPTGTTLCNGRCCAGACSPSNVCLASNLDASVVRDAGRDANSSVVDGSTACGVLGVACSMTAPASACPVGYTCDLTHDVCLPERVSCGGFAGAECDVSSPFPTCLYFAGASYGICLTPSEAVCACTHLRGIFSCPS